MKKSGFKSFSLFLIFAFFLFLPVKSSALDYTSPSFIVRDPVIGAGGGYTSSGSFQLFSSQDTAFTNIGASLNFIGQYGFLYFPAPATPTPTPTPTPGGGGGGGASPGAPTTPPYGYCGRIADLNCDGRVNLLDFSILLYYFDKPAPVNPFYDLNSDGEIDLKDLSVMFYHWDE